MNDRLWPHTHRTRTQMRANLANYRRRVTPLQGRRAAAVSVVLASSENSADTCFLLTKRTQHMNAHAGQYALPGGKLDPGEYALDTARRELSEELGIDVSPHQILGVLDDVPTRSGYVITPFVAWLGGRAGVRPAPDEIAEVHRIPLGDLFAGCGRGTNRGLPAMAVSAPAVFSLYIPALGHDLFAPTAAIMDHFREVTLMGRPTPAVRFGEPEFARR